MMLTLMAILASVHEIVPPQSDVRIINIVRTQWNNMMQYLARLTASLTQMEHTGDVRCPAS